MLKCTVCTTCNCSWKSAPICPYWSGCRVPCKDHDSVSILMAKYPQHEFPNIWSNLFSVIGNVWRPGQPVMHDHWFWFFLFATKCWCCRRVCWIDGYIQIFWHCIFQSEAYIQIWGILVLPSGRLILVLPFGLLLQCAKENTLPVVDIYYYLVKWFGGKRQVLVTTTNNAKRKGWRGLPRDHQTVLPFCLVLDIRLNNSVKCKL